MVEQSMASDEALMRDVARGERAALEPLLRRYAHPLLNFIQRMLGDRHRSEEVFQEVFLAVWNKRGQYAHPRLFRSWLFTIAANKCYEVGRSRQTRSFALDERELAPTVAAPSPEDRAIATETAHMVTTAVLQLPPQQRAVVVLRIWHDLPYDRIAEIVGRTEATVRSHMHHGLAGLRRYLEPRLAQG